MSTVFVVRQTAKDLTVFHNGGPINRSTGSDRGAAENHHDLRKMLSFGHSNKQLGPSFGNVTGKFGLGFKSVFLITDQATQALERLRPPSIDRCPVSTAQIHRERLMRRYRFRMR